MRRLTILAVVLVVVTTAIGPVAGSESSRSDTLEYAKPNGLQVFTPGNEESYWVVYGDPPFPTFSAQRGETLVSIKIEDDLGKVTAGHVHVDSNRDGQVDDHMSVCGKTDKPLSIPPRARIEIWILNGTCRDGTLSFATEGLVTATFHK
jgi:hypothetical protein